MQNLSICLTREMILYLYHHSQVLPRRKPDSLKRLEESSQRKRQYKRKTLYLKKYKTRKEMAREFFRDAGFPDGEDPDAKV